MKTFLLSWSPKRWEWENLPDWIDRIEKGKASERRWSCGNSKRPQKGDRVFLIRLGEEPKGIFGSGTIVRGSYEDRHWEEEKALQGQKSRFLELQFDVLLNPEENIFSRKHLNEPPFNKMHWDIQKSGAEIPFEIAIELEMRWDKFNKIERYRIPEEVIDCSKLEEGATRRISVNIYERNAKARNMCIAHYGTKCVVCDFDFFEKYGDVGKDFINIHHLIPLSKIGKKYQVDPVNDLRPVCSNCHSVIHRSHIAYTIEDVRSFINGWRN
jgi:5-methylcytosine-specific restriction protein A